MSANAKVDVAVLGGGVIGASIAWVAARQGVDVALVDAARAIPPASTAAAGMLAPGFELIDDDALGLHAFARASLKRWPAFADDLQNASGVDLDLRLNGILGVATGADDAQRRAAHFATSGSAELLSRDALLALEPQVGAAVSGGVLAPGEGQVDPRKVMTALTIALAGHGTVTKLNARCVDANADDAGVTLSLEDGGVVNARRAVVATGALEAFNRNFCVPKIYSVKGEAFSVETPEPLLERVVRGARAYLCPKSDGRLVVGATEVAMRKTLNVDASAICDLRQSAEEILPGLAGRPEIERWAGLRPSTQDGAPAIGVAAGAPQSVIFALGHHRNGVLLAPETADAVLAALTSQALPAPSLGPDRLMSA